MKPAVTSELYWLVLTTLMTGLFWVPYILQRVQDRGLWTALSEPQGSVHTESHWARRMMRAHQNAIENLVIFATLVLMLQATGNGTATTAMACMVYFFARATHFVVYTLAVPLLRPLSFFIGFFAQLALALTLLGALA
jgi:uncharacterized MAPEG superfamily protein